MADLRGKKATPFAWPLALLSLFIIFMPYKPYGLVTFYFTLALSDFALLGVSLITVLAEGILRKLQFPRPLFTDGVLVCGFIIVAASSSTLNGNANAVYATTLITWLAVIYGLTSFVIISKGSLQIAVRAVIISACIVSFIAIGQSFFGVFMDIGRPAPARMIGPITIPVERSAGPYGTYGRFGMLLLLAFPAVLLERLDPETPSLFPNRWSVNAILLLLTVGILISQTRGTWIAAIVVTSITLAIYGKRKLSPQQQRQALVVSAICLIPVLIFALLEMVEMNVSTVLIRLKVYTIAVHVFMDNPIFGVGYQHFIPAASQYSEVTAIHNVFLEVLATLGLIGAVIFGLLFLRVGTRLAKTMVNTADEGTLPVAIPIGAIGVIVQAQVVRGLYAQEFWFTLGLVTAAYFVTFSKEETAGNFEELRTVDQVEAQ